MRKTTRITIDAEGRDKGKTFELTEKAAAHAEDWAIRAFSGMARAGISIPDDFQEMGLAGVAAIGFKAFAAMPYADMKPLMDEMFTCVSFVSSSGIIRALTPDDIEEIPTRLRLRKEIFELHTGFFAKGQSLKSARDASAPSVTPNTSTSPDPSQS